MKLYEIENKIDFSLYRQNIEAAKKGHMLFRGRRDSSKAIMEFDTTSQYRRAANTDDFYKQMLDIANPNWPPRGKSLICTTNESIAWDYGISGGVYIVIPRDGTEVAFTHNHDLWDTGVNYINEYPEALIYQYNLTIPIPKHKSLTLESWFTYMTNIKKTLLDGGIKVQIEVHNLYDDTINNWINDPTKNKEDLYNSLLKIMKYENFNFTKSNNLLNQFGRGECWFSGTCIMLYSGYIKDFLRDPLNFDPQ